MSWYKGMKDVQLKGFKSLVLTLSSELLQETGVDYPFYIDLKQLLSAAFGTSLKDVIGSGNFEILNYQFWDFMFESYVWPNWWTNHDEALFSIESDVNFLIDVAVLSIDVENDYTDRISTRDNFIITFTHPDFSDADKKLTIYLGGFFSPAQELIMSNFNDVAKDSLFHECIHALKRSGDDLLKDIMYGGTEAGVTEEIMTHLVTDKFGSLSKLHSILNDGIQVSYDTKDGILSPNGLAISKANKLISHDGTKPLHASISKRGINFTQTRIPLSANLGMSKKLRSELRNVVKGKKDSHKNVVRQTLSKAGMLQKDSLIRESKQYVLDTHK